MKVTLIGNVCSYCGKDYAIEENETGCCGEVHSEIGYEDETGDLILESELTNEHEIDN